jgi:hypothetical protein
MLPSLDARLWKLPPDLKPLAEAAWQHRSRGASLHPDGTVQVAPMPWVGPEAFAFVLYPPAERAWITAFGSRAGQPVPEPYAAVLAALNGCFAFGLALYGLAPSLQTRLPRVDRRALEPLDLDAANHYWAQEYRGAEGEFHFGGCSWTATENVGYFLTPEGVFRSRRKGGEVLREWPSLRQLLADELPAAEARDRERLTGRTWPWEARRNDG